MGLILEAKFSGTVFCNFPKKFKLTTTGLHSVILLLPFLNAFGLLIYKEMVM